MDPEACKFCHPKHHEEWARSMHAYAADDPVFLAMNRRGQRETKGKLGKFCVNCHAPVAVRTGATVDGLNLASLPAKLRGVTCYFCHTVSGIEAGHSANNPLITAEDGILRGQLSEPFATRAHRSQYSPLLDRDRIESAEMCGSCHDIVNDRGTHIERTFEEWRGSVFSQPGVGSSCGQCHMDQSAAPERAALLPHAPLRRTHHHGFPAVDAATTPFPDAESARKQVALNQAFLNTTLQSALCVTGRPEFDRASLLVVLDNVGAGHAFPSGSAQDRRLWVEIIAYSKGRAIYTSGKLEKPLEPITGRERSDPDLWLLGDRMFSETGHETHDFWEAACYESELLPAQLTFSRMDPRFYRSHVARSYPGPGARPPLLTAYPDRVTLRVRLSPIGQDVLIDLMKSGDLKTESARTSAVLYDVGAPLEWTPRAATEKFRDRDGTPISCISATALRAASDKTFSRRLSTCKPGTPEGAPHAK